MENLARTRNNGVSGTVFSRMFDKELAVLPLRKLVTPFSEPGRLAESARATCFPRKASNKPFKKFEWF
jgi:hypothetical protein